jgi:pimeloyl-ACP methyl ester carboxylesterase
MATSDTRLVELQPDVAINAVTTTPTASDHSPITVVFLHFWGGSSSTWSSVIPLLSQNYPTVALDFRGWGSSTGPADKQAYSITQLANDVESVVNKLQLENVVFVGLSMGAKVAQCIAGRQSLPGLKGIVLVSPAPPTPLVLPEDMREQQVHAFENAQSAEFVARNVLTATALGDDVVQALVLDMLRGNEFARAAWPSYAMGEDITALVEGIKVPALVVAAEKDIVEPLERVKTEVVGRLVRVELAVVPGSGHLSPVEAPKVVAGFLVTFLESLGL